MAKGDYGDGFFDSVLYTTVSAPLLAGGCILHAVLTNQNALDPKVALTAAAVNALVGTAYVSRHALGNAAAAGIGKLQDAYIAAKEALVAGIAALGAKKEIKQPNKSGQKGL